MDLTNTPKRILVADDDLIARLLLCENLSGYGTCDAVVDGSEAVRAFRLALQRNRPYRLICLDIMMPNMDGIDALREIRNIEKANNLPSENLAIIIMVTALVDELKRKSARSAMCDAYLTKPLDHNQLVTTLKKFGLIEQTAQ